MSHGAGEAEKRDGFRVGAEATVILDFASQGELAVVRSDVDPCTARGFQQQRLPNLPGFEERRVGLRLRVWLRHHPEAPEEWVMRPKQGEVGTTVRRARALGRRRRTQEVICGR